VLWYLQDQPFPYLLHGTPTLQALVHLFPKKHLEIVCDVNFEPGSCKNI
jgi:hypothetical protein